MAHKSKTSAIGLCLAQISLTPPKTPFPNPQRRSLSVWYCSSCRIFIPLDRSASLASALGRRCCRRSGGSRCGRCTLLRVLLPKANRQQCASEQQDNHCSVQQLVHVDEQVHVASATSTEAMTKRIVSNATENVEVLKGQKGSSGTQRMQRS